MNYETAAEIEIIIAGYFDYRINCIIPNISFGMKLHECDILVLSKHGYATEIEIKVSKSDIVKDRKKEHGHNSNKIKYLYFAIPIKLDKDDIIKIIPERAGIIIINREGLIYVKRKPQINTNANVFTIDDKYQLARLGAIRIWGLKRKFLELKQERSIK